MTMNFNKTDFTANDGNIRVYAQNQNDTGTTITNITNNSRIIFDDNKGGGFVFGKGTNQVNIDKSIVDVSNNGGNASNGGVWTVIDSTLTINGNRGGHGLSCQYFQMTNSKFESIHNGYAGVFTGTDDSSFTNCDVTIQCNGENLLSYSGLDITLNGHTLTVDNCGIAYLGTVGRSGNVITTNGSRVVMADAAQFGVDSHSNNIKSNCTPVITDNTKLATATSHYLFTNPNVDTKYARGNTEKDNVNYVSNDADLWLDVLYDKEGKVIEKTVKEVVTAVDSQYIDIFNDNELAHHTYNWSKGTITDKATETKYGVMAYECTTCHKYLANTDNHPNSYNCRGTYVYAPLVGVTFDSNAGNDEVNNMPEAQTAINYADATVEPNQVPQRVSKDNVSYAFTGWYTDKECTEKFDFSTELTDNWTILYAGWKEQTSVSVTKVWDDENNQDGKRPDSVTIMLLANGEETNNTITLNADNNWEGIFTGLDKYADGKEILYTVKETEIEGYTSKITGDVENGFVITNTHTPEKVVINSGTKGISIINTVKTGDTSSFAYLILLLIGSVTGIGVLGIRRRK